MSLGRRLGCQTLSKEVDISSKTARVVVVTIKNPEKLIRYDSQTICSCTNRPKTILEIRKKYFEDFNDNRKKNRKVVRLSCRPLHSILKYREHRWDLPTIWKIVFLQIVKSSANIYESAGSLFFRTTTKYNQDQTPLKSQVWLWVVLKGKAGKEIPVSARLEFLKKFLVKHFCFVKCRRRHFRAIP